MPRRLRASRLQRLLAKMRELFEAGDFEKAATIARIVAPYVHPRRTILTQIDAEGRTVRREIVEEITEPADAPHGDSQHRTVAL